MDENAIIDRIKDSLVEVLGIEKDEIKADSSIIEDLGAESIDLLDLVFRLEQAFNIRISRKEIEKKARDALSEEEFEMDEELSDQAIERLKKHLPEVSEDRFRPGLRSSEIPLLFTVRTFSRMLKEKLEEGLDASQE
ncbi:MAG: acyl carrier protein [bacterium]